MALLPNLKALLPSWEQLEETDRPHLNIIILFLLKSQATIIM